MRRGHGSTKVPNVKLRPAQKAKAVSRTPTDITPVDDGDAAEYAVNLKKPFAKLVLCASGIQDKNNVLRKAAQLGARTMSDLTDQVTHLICDAPGSAKYNYCVAHRIPIMTSTWILDLFSKWVEGEEIEVNPSLPDYRLPAFTSVRLCMTGIDDMDERELIQSVLTKEGGVFVKSVEGNIPITHLLCGSDRSGDVDERGWTQKMIQVEKLNAKKKEKERTVLVWNTWFSDCAHFGGLLDVDDYLVTKPRPKSRIPEEERNGSLTQTAASENPAVIPPSLPVNALTITGDEDEVAIVKRVPEATARLWHGLVKPRGFDVKGGKLVRSPTKSSSAGTVLSGSDVRTKSLAAPESPLASRIAAFKRTNSFAPHEMLPIASSSKLPSAPPRDASTQSSIFTATNANTNSLARSTAPNTFTSSFLAPVKEYSVPEGERDLFVGKSFLALGEASSPKLEEEVQLRGGTVVTAKEDADYIIVRLVSGSKLCWEEKDEQIQARFRTECWLEQCIYKERICEPDEHISFAPLRVIDPVPGASNLSVHLSGLDAFERTSSLRLLKAVGISHSEHLSRRNTHLLCPSGMGIKVEKAREWNIPVVNIQWLHAIVSTGENQDSNGFLVPSQGLDTKMADITNSVEPSIAAAQESSHNTEAVTAVITNKETPVTPRAAEKRPARDSADTEHPQNTFGEPVGGLLRNSPNRMASSRRPVKSNSLPLPNDGPVPSTSAPQQRRANSEKTTVFHAASSRVPSSKTPSPLKLPRASGTASPPPLTRENANMLKDAITSLLGKREMQEDAEADVAKPARGSKRARPQARRVASSISPAPLDFSTAPFNPDDFPASQLPPNSQLPPSIVAPTEDDANKGMRVTYEDPIQRERQRRLKEMLTGKVEPRKEVNHSDDVGMRADSEPVPPKTARGRKGKGRAKRSDA